MAESPVLLLGGAAATLLKGSVSAAKVDNIGNQMQIAPYDVPRLPSMIIFYFSPISRTRSAAGY